MSVSVMQHIHPDRNLPMGDLDFKPANVKLIIQHDGKEVVLPHNLPDMEADEVVMTERSVEILCVILIRHYEQ